MKRTIYQTRSFAKVIDSLIGKKKLLLKDFESFKRELVENPEKGDLIRGTGGIRKIRLKSSSKGKSGGFRVCYFDDSEEEEIFLLLIYAKSERENISSQEKKYLKELTDAIKRR